MCLHKGNVDVLRDSVKLLAKLGVRSLKCNSVMDMGEWLSPELKNLRLSLEEALEITENYIPQYFEDDAPLSIMMTGAFLYEKGSPKGWGIYYKRMCPCEEEDEMLSCPVLKESFYLGPDGLVAPCQGMCDTGFANHFPNLNEQHLCDILKESDYVRYSYATVGDVRRGNDECRKYDYMDRCTGSCRNSALIEGDNYYGVNPEACFFFRNGWEERIKTVAQPAYEEYIKRNPQKAGAESEKRKQTSSIGQTVCWGYGQGCRRHTLVKRGWF